MPIVSGIYDPDRAATFDVETSYAQHKGRTGSPFAPNGEVMLCSAGFKLPGGFTGKYLVSNIEGANTGIMRGSQEWLDAFPDLTDVDVLVAHNAKFDLLWFWRHPNLEAFLKRGGRIWCTLYAEFLLSGSFYHLHQLPHLVPSLHNVAKRRGCTLKLDIVAAMWEKGIRTEDIPEDVLMEYQEGDCVTTSEIYVQQVAQAMRQNQLHMIHHRMDGLLATTEMEFNGLFIDQDEAEMRLAELNALYDTKAAALDEHIPKDLPDGLTFNWNSRSHLSALIFGGTIKYKGREQVLDDDGNPVYFQTKVDVQVIDDDGNPVRYKGGKNKGAIKTKKVTVPDLVRGPKTRGCDKYHKVTGLVSGKPKWRTPASKDELNPALIEYSTSREVLDEVKAMGVGMVKDLLALRGLNKDIGTYYRKETKGVEKGMLTTVHDNGVIHHNLSHCVTVTARLSCFSPNLQNLSGTGKSMVRKMFTSRFGHLGIVVEGDFSQLEVVCKGVLSGDKTLLQALQDGIDFHCDWLSLTPEGAAIGYDEVVRLCKKEHDPKWVAARKNIKPLTFGEAYGAGITKLSEDTGLKPEVIQTAIDNRKKKYAAMYAYDEKNSESVQASRRLSCLQTPQGHQAGIGYLRIATDTILHFVETDAMDWQQHQGIMTSFSPTTIKNYPSQGLGGEIMQVQAGRIFRWLINNDRFGDRMLMTNTVHDCLWLDSHLSVADKALEAKAIMEDVCDFFNREYPNVNWDTPFPTEFEFGRSMYELGHTDMNSMWYTWVRDNYNIR